MRAFRSAVMVLVLLLCTVGLIGGVALAFPKGQADRLATQADDTYRAYVDAWKKKDLSALQQLISDQYMAINFEGKLSDKQNELATAKSDLDWTEMTVDEIHSQVTGTTAILSGVISAAAKHNDGTPFHARVRFLAVMTKNGGKWQLVATQSAPLHVEGNRSAGR